METTREDIPESDSETVDNETFFNDLVSGLTYATNRLREENAQEIARQQAEADAAK